MTVSIVACGNSAENWHSVKTDLSIGTNDAMKWGAHPDQLVVIDSPKRFLPERMDIIKSTQSKFIVRDDQWKGILPNYEKVRLQQFTKHLKKGHVYCSKTSSFVALSLAFNQGATDVILFGVDLNDHATFNPKNRIRDYELRQYEKFCRMLAEQGTKVWVSSEESALSRFLNVWTCAGVANGSDCKSEIHQFESDQVLDAMNYNLRMASPNRINLALKK